MARYRDADVTFGHPDAWKLRTLVGFAQSANRKAPTLLVVREPIRKGDTVRTHAQRKLFAMRAIEDFALLESADVTVAGLPATRVRYSYSTQDGPIEQSQTFVVAPADHDIVTSFLATALKADVEAVRPLVDAALASVRFAIPAPPPRSDPDGLSTRDVPMPGSQGPASRR